MHTGITDPLQSGSALWVNPSCMLRVDMSLGPENRCAGQRRAQVRLCRWRLCPRQQASIESIAQGWAGMNKLHILSLLARLWSLPCYSFFWFFLWLSLPHCAGGGGGLAKLFGRAAVFRAFYIAHGCVSLNVSRFEIERFIRWSSRQRKE